MIINVYIKPLGLLQRQEQTNIEIVPYKSHAGLFAFWSLEEASQSMYLRFQVRGAKSASRGTWSLHSLTTPDACLTPRSLFQFAETLNPLNISYLFTAVIASKASQLFWFHVFLFHWPSLLKRRYHIFFSFLSPQHLAQHLSQGWYLSTEKRGMGREKEAWKDGPQLIYM